MTWRQRLEGWVQELRTTKDCQQPSYVGRDAWDSFSLRVSRKTNHPADTLILDLGPPRLGENKFFPVLSHRVCGNLFHYPQETRTGHLSILHPGEAGRLMGSLTGTVCKGLERLPKINSSGCPRRKERGMDGWVETTGMPVTYHEPLKTAPCIHSYLPPGGWGTKMGNALCSGAV